MLQAAGVIWREQTQTIPPAVTFGITARGEELGTVLDSLDEITERRQAEGAFSCSDVAVK